ncbi:MAG: Sua5/YciO/YrdC/YwlC family protein [Buchnera aphidicola (Schlechtendalia peitan)]
MKLNNMSLSKCIDTLKNNNIIAYPTESVFGLGCNPNSKSAIIKLLKLKKRVWRKGLILVASHYYQVRSYISEHELSFQQRIIISKGWSYPITFLVPAKSSVPYWLTGQSKFLAIRISSHYSIKKLCNAFGAALISTSANYSGLKPCKTYEEVVKQFGKNFPILCGTVGKSQSPSKIINVISGELIRGV